MSGKSKRPIYYTLPTPHHTPAKATKIQLARRKHPQIQSSLREQVAPYRTMFASSELPKSRWAHHLDAPFTRRLAVSYILVYGGAMELKWVANITDTSHSHTHTRHTKQSRHIIHVQHRPHKRCKKVWEHIRVVPDVICGEVCCGDGCVLRPWTIDGIGTPLVFRQTLIGYSSVTQKLSHGVNSIRVTARGVLLCVECCSSCCTTRGYNRILRLHAFECAIVVVTEHTGIYSCPSL